MKKLMAIALTAILALSMIGCNRQLVDTTFAYDEAIISLPNGEVIHGEIDSWLDFENSDQIQVKINGVTYLVHSSNIALIS